VVEVVDPGIERLPVNEAVNPAEVEVAEQGNDDKRRNEPHEMIFSSDGRKISVRIGPQPDRFVIQPLENVRGSSGLGVKYVHVSAATTAIMSLTENGSQPPSRFLSRIRGLTGHCAMGDLGMGNGGCQFHSSRPLPGEGSSLADSDRSLRRKTFRTSGLIVAHHIHADKFRGFGRFQVTFSEHLPDPLRRRIGISH
jgi:hypothetical protein